MSSDIQTLMQWIRLCLLVAAFCSTAFPVLYAFFPWHKTVLGRLLMLQAISFALAIDMTLLFQFWHPVDVVLLFWLNALVLTLVAISTFAMTVMLWRINRVKQVHPSQNRRNTDV